MASSITNPKIPWRDNQNMKLALLIKKTKFPDMTWREFLPIFNELFTTQLAYAGFPNGIVPDNQASKLPTQLGEADRAKNKKLWDPIKALDKTNEGRLIYDPLFNSIKQKAAARNLPGPVESDEGLAPEAESNNEDEVVEEDETIQTQPSDHFMMDDHNEFGEVSEDETVETQAPGRLKSENNVATEGNEEINATETWPPHMLMSRGDDGEWASLTPHPGAPEFWYQIDRNSIADTSAEGAGMPMQNEILEDNVPETNRSNVGSIDGEQRGTSAAQEVENAGQDIFNRLYETRIPWQEYNAMVRSEMEDDDPNEMFGYRLP